MTCPDRSLFSARPPVLQRRARARTALALALVGLTLGGCKSVGLGDVTGSISKTDSVLPQSDAALRQYSEQWGRKFDANQGDKAAAINYARALRALTQFDQAAAVMRQIAIKMPNDMEVLGNYGKALADAGRFEEATEVLSRAHTQERPNWSILSAQGSIADQMGDHATAQNYYHTALKINPGEPSILSNLGLSYALSKQLPMAEQTLRDAVQHPAADSRVRQNLALVLALQGKFTEAEAVSSRDLPPAQAAQNVATIRRMIAQSNTWRDLQTLDGRKPQPAASKPARARQRVAAGPATNAPIELAVAPR